MEFIVGVLVGFFIALVIGGFIKWIDSNPPDDYLGP